MQNCTPHIVRVIKGPDDEIMVFEPSGSLAQVKMITTDEKPLQNGCPVVRVAYGEASLPPGDGPFIVSTLFADAYRAQNGMNGVGLFVPDSGPSAIRKNGQVFAVRHLIKR